MSRNLEIHTGVLHYCTFGLEAAVMHRMLG